MNVIGRMELELTYYDVAVQCVNHNAAGTPFLMLSDQKNSELLKESKKKRRRRRRRRRRKERKNEERE